MPGPLASARLLATVVLAALAALIASPALAHTSLIGTAPEEGETVAALDEVSLEFSESLLDIGNELVLVNADGVETALDIVASFSPRTIAAAVPDDALVPGEAVLRWRVVAEDGHPIEGTLTFTFAPDAKPAASATASASPSASAVAASPDASAATTAAPTVGAVVSTPDATDAADPAAGSAGVPAWVWLAGLGALGAAAVAAIVALTRKGGGAA